MNAQSRLLDEILQALLSGRPELATKMQVEGWTILRCAVFEGLEQLVERILSLAPEMIDDEAEGDRCTALDIAFAERHENVVLQLLNKNPNKLDAKTSDGFTVLHRAAEKGLDTVVAHLLAVKPELIRARASDGRLPLHCAASEGHLPVVARLLAASPKSINATGENCKTALHYAASSGNRSLVEHLLASPGLHHDVRGKTALHVAADVGDIPIAECLLAARPELIKPTTTESYDWSPLHFAATSGHCAMVEYLLSVNPALIDALASGGFTVLHATTFENCGSNLPVARTLLTIKPELIFVKDHQGFTTLHMVAEHCRSKELIEEMWRLDPEALRAVNDHQDTPFRIALRWENDVAIELFQWALTWEEIENAYLDEETSYEERYRPVMETQCESLSLWLLPDVVGTVFEYLGFERVKKSSSSKTRDS